MAQQRWYTAKGVGMRYDTGPKWVWHQMKKDPRFPRGVRFSGGMTRWNEEDLAAYDDLIINQASRS